MITLPSHCPSGATYRPPGFPVKLFRSVSGAAARVLYGDRSSQAGLSLEFSLDTERAAQWAAAFESARGTFDQVTVPDVVWEMAEEIEATIPSHIAWFFASEPTIERLSAGRTRVQVELIGDLEA